MKKASRVRNPGPDTMPIEIDFSGGVRGKYAKRYAAGTNVVLLDPDICVVFRDSESVNRVLRSIVQALKKKSA